MRIIFNLKTPGFVHPFTLSFTILLTLLWQTIALADVAVITHPSSASISDINTSTIKSIYLGKLKSWPNGSAISVIDQSAGSDTRKLFLKKVVGKKEIKFDSYWSRKAFSGKGTPPKNLGNDTDVKAWVSKNKGSIGYIDASAVDESVKILITVK